MKTWRHLLRSLSGIKTAVARRPRTYRPVVEILEDRFVPSGDLTGGYVQINLASDVPGLARVLDPHLVNTWGMSSSPTGPFWMAESGSGVSDLLDGRGDIVPLLVNVPSASHGIGSPTGTVFNAGPNFVVSANGLSASGQFLFATADGTISAWAPAADAKNAIIAVDNSADHAAYLGLALAVDDRGQSFLYAADIAHGRIDVFDDHFHPVASAGGFLDPNLPDGFAPFNVQLIGNQLFVTYVPDEIGYATGANGRGLIDVFDLDGDLTERFASGGTLDNPWGMALAPASYGPFGGALLVGNNGDGRISAFDPHTGAFLGQLADDNGIPIANPNLWSLSFGNGHLGGDANTLFFAAGYDDDAHGLFGAIQDPLHHGADTAGPLGFDPAFPGERSDYPLPPTTGPLLAPPARPQPSAVLLPLSQSSLALAPTLTSVVQPNSTPSALASAALPPSASIVTVSFVSTSAANVPLSTSLIPSATDSFRSAANEIRNNSASLNAFLDLNVIPDVLESDPEVRPPVVAAPPSDAPPIREARLADEIGLTPIDVRAAMPPAIPTTSANSARRWSDLIALIPARPLDRAVEAAQTATVDDGIREHDDWAKPFKTLIFIVGLSWAWSCTLTRRRSHRPAPSELAVTRQDPIR